VQEHCADIPNAKLIRGPTGRAEQRYSMEVGRWMFKKYGDREMRENSEVFYSYLGGYADWFYLQNKTSRADREMTKVLLSF
jgi:hypothetical protein